MSSSTNISGCKPKAIPNVTGGMWGWQGWFTIIDIAILFVVLFNQWVPIEFAMVAASLMLMSTQIITIADGIVGFSNSSVLAIACLLAIADAFAATGAIDYYLTKFLGRPKTLGGALVRVMVPSMFIAAWISSTAVVAILIPIVTRWARKLDQPLSQLLMPLCNAVHLGGTCTLIGTTTNLVIAGYAQQYYCRQMGIFVLTTVGLPVALAGMGVLMLLGPKILPDRAEFERRSKYVGNFGGKAKGKPSPWLRLFRNVRDVVLRRPSSTTGIDNTATNQEATQTYNEVKGNAFVEAKALRADFTVHALVPHGASAVGQTIQDAGLRHLHDLFLVAVIRGDTRYTAVGSDFVLEAGDIVAFSGVVDNFVKFAAEHGLKPITVDALGASPDEAKENSIAADPVSSFTIQAVVRDGSELVGKTPKEVNFRTTYNASIIGIYRAGQRLNNVRLGQVPLKVGDVLVAVTGPEFDWDQIEVHRDLKPRFVNPHPRSASTPSTATSTAVTLNGDTESIDAKSRDYLFSMRVTKQAPVPLMKPLAGQTIDEAGLRNIPSVQLVAVERDGEVARSLGPNFVVKSGDVLWFVGDREGLASLRVVAGLEDADSGQIKRLHVPQQYRRLLEVVVSLQSDLIGKTVRESRFRTRFEAVIVAIQRHGTRLFARIGDVVLEPGDVLIIDAGPQFIKRYGEDPNFLVISEIVRSEPPRFDRFYFALFICTAMVAMAAAFNQAPYSLDLVLFTLWALGILLAFGVTTRQRVYRAIEWHLLITIAAAFGLATALQNTGVAGIIGSAITDAIVHAGGGELAVLAVIMILTEVIAALITAKAGALLMFPIAAAAAKKLNINPDRVLIALMMGASDYTTPQGYVLPSQPQRPRRRWRGHTNSHQTPNQPHDPRPRPVLLQGLCPPRRPVRDLPQHLPSLGIGVLRRVGRLGRGGVPLPGLVHLRRPRLCGAPPLLFAHHLPPT